MKIVVWMVAAALCCLQANAQPATTPDAVNKVNVSGKKTGNAKLSVGSMVKSQKGFVVDVPNPSEQSLTVSGVQSSQSLFVVDFDKTIGPKKTGKVVVDYEAVGANAGSSEYLRLKTNYGIQMIRVEIDRPKEVDFSAEELIWKPGSEAKTQSVTVKISHNVAVIQGVKAMGVDNTATLTDLGSGNYRIDITPKSTEAGKHFPVFIDFSPEMPGVQRAIICSIK